MAERVEDVYREIEEVETNPNLTADERIWRLEGLRHRAQKARHGGDVVDLDMDYVVDSGEAPKRKPSKRKKLKRVLERLRSGR